MPASDYLRFGYTDILKHKNRFRIAGAERPKLKAFIPEMQRVMAGVMCIDEEDVSVKATTTEKLGFTGREEGIAAYATVLIHTS